MLVLIVMTSLLCGCGISFFNTFVCFFSFFFFFNDTATTEIYTLSLHDALPISSVDLPCPLGRPEAGRADLADRVALDRKSTRLNSSHSQISYAVFCLKKKKTLAISSELDAKCTKRPRMSRHARHSIATKLHNVH